MLHSELKHSVGRRSHYLDGENVRPEGIGPSLLLSSEEAGKNCRVVDVNAVHRIVAISVTLFDSAHGEETIIYRCGWSFCYGGMLREISGFSRGVIDFGFAFTVRLSRYESNGHDFNNREAAS